VPAAAAVAVAGIALVANGAHNDSSGHSRSGGRAEAAPGVERSIEVTPRRGLTPGEVVEVVGEGFEPNVQIGVAVCRADAIVDGDTDHCDLTRVAGARSSREGTFRADVVVAALLTTASGADVDCTNDAESCVVAAAPIGRYEDVAGVEIDFGSGARPERPRLAVSRRDDSASPPTVGVEGSGFSPGADVSFQLCRVTDEGGADLSACAYDDAEVVQASPAGRAEATLVVGPIRLRDGRLVADCRETPRRCVIAGESVRDPTGSTPLDQAVS
jgi:hypothetical protein